MTDRLDVTGLQDPTMRVRAGLLERALLRGTTVSEALDQADRMWRFVRDGSGSPAGEAVGVAYYRDAGCWSWIDADGRIFVPDSGYFDRHPIWGGIRSVKVDGQHMVEIPAFYYRRTRDGDDFEVWVSPSPAPGFELHPAFKQDGRPLQTVCLGAYEANWDVDTAGSQPNCEPLTNVSFEQAQVYATRYGGPEGFGLWSIYELAAVQMLMLIELGTPDVQSAIGMGNVRSRGPKPTGTTAAAWRGLHELWGNVWQMVDGLRHDAEGRIEVWDADGHRRWINTGLKAADLNRIGYIDSFRCERGDGWDLGALFVPGSLAEDPEDAMVSDLSIGPDYGRASVTYHGGYSHHAANAGVFGLHLHIVRSNSCSHVGFRPAFRNP